MKFKIFVYAALLFANAQAQGSPPVEWTIIGAGPAGIAATGLLLDLGIAKDKLIWVDPEFNVGRIGKFYENVPGNTKTKTFIEFLQACKTFCKCTSNSIEELYNYHPDKEYPLYIIINPLRDITAFLRTLIISHETEMANLDYKDDYWHITLKNQTRIISRHVVLATGSHPRSLNYKCECEIPLDVALDKNNLENYVDQKDTVAVIGSAHSAVLVMKYLCELTVTRIINFYKTPLQFPTDMGGWFEHKENGLAGTAAQWAKDVLINNPPGHLIRMPSSQDSLKAWLPICNKIVYACGFDRNELPEINGQKPYNSYDSSTGKIAPRLFGIGIAFPELATDPNGNTEPRVGLQKFMEYIQRIIPEWMKKERMRVLSKFNDLFNINIL